MSAPRCTRSEVLGAISAGLLVVLFCLILLWHNPLLFWNDDYELSVLPIFADMARSWSEGHWAVPVSLLAALVASLSGWIICWGATDWFGALGAFTWLPCAWWGAARALDPRRSKWRFLWPAPFVYLVVTGGFPYTVLMLLVLIAWLAIKSLIETRSIFSIAPMLFGVLLGLGLAAPAWLALLDYVHGSARAVQDSAEHFQWRVPITALPGFVFPNWTVNWSDFSSRLMPHTATELASGFVPP